MKTYLSRLIARTPLQYVHVRVRKGAAKGAHWTLMPFSANWREGGEGDLDATVKLLGDMNGRSCWDFGAHFGIHAIGMGMLVGARGEVAAFEPDGAAYRRLTRHLRMNPMSWVKAFNVGVSDTFGEAELIIAEGEGSTLSHFRYEDESEKCISRTVRVKTVAPDGLVAEGQLRLPDLIKVDVQGHGAKALAGSIDSIVKARPTILFSSHSPWELEGTRMLLEPLGYRPFSLGGAAVLWSSFVDSTAVLRPI